MNQELKRRMRWWIPLTIAVVAAASALGLWWWEAPFLEPALMGVGLLALLLIWFWYVFFTGLPWKRRAILIVLSVGVVAGIGVGISQLTRIEGSIGGSGVPRLVWKWTPKKEGAARPLELQAQPSAAASSPALAPSSHGEYPQFLGPNRSQTLSGIPLRRDWTESPPKTLWRQPVGLGWSAFAVSGSHAITQEQRREDELIVCYELETGRAVWAHTNRVRFSETLGGDGPRATPTISQGRVFAMGASGILDCLEESTGKLVWSRDVLGENHLSNLSWGKSCSPLLVHQLVLVTGGNEREKGLLAYEAATGKPAWQAGHDRASYCSPMLASLAGQEQIVMVNGHSVSGHDLADGKVLWEYPWPDEYAKATQPLTIDTNRLLIAAGYGVGCVMLKLDRTSAGSWSASVLWKNRNLKPKFTNLVRRGNWVYGLDDGILACVELEQGARAWKEGRYGHGQIILIDDLLLVQAESGEIALVEVSPQGPHERARFPALQGKTWNNPALVGDLLLVRNDHEAACYRLPLQSPAP